MAETLTAAHNNVLADDYLDTAFRARGVGGWRALYLRMLRELDPASVAEIGSGAPDFLLAVGAPRLFAVDAGARYREAFQRAGVAFLQRDLERERLGDIGKVEVAVCSDVFEHLVNPRFALQSISEILAPHGVLFAHVPNEYRLGPALAIMLGRRETTQFHGAAREWDDPHVRRFSARGFEQFLRLEFRYNLPLTHLRYGRAARWMQRFGLSPPYCLQGGPTFASCNDPETYQRLRRAAARLAREPR